MKKLLTVCGLLLVLAGCGAMEVSVDKDVVSFVVPSGAAAYGVFSMLSEADNLSGFALDYEIAPNADALSARVLEGVDVAVVPVNLASILYNRGLDYQVAAVATWGNLFVLSTDDAVTGWQDLSSTRIYGFGRGLVPDATFAYLLGREGISTDLEYLTSPQEVAQAMIGGVASTALIAEPAATMILAQTDARAILDLQEEWGGGGYPQAVVIISGDFAQRDPELALEVLGEIQVAMVYANENPESIAVLAAGLGETVNPDALVASFPRLNIRFEAASNAKGAILAYLEALYQMSPELIGGQVPGDGFFY
ncbi:MAG: hypothetical protein FWF59_06400 [Turicibacter sp.]|nr:hypothetical protein [Turicibacter sp.]